MFSEIFKTPNIGEVGRAVKMALRTRFGFAAVNHLYSEEEKQILHGYQSLEYLPPHSKVEGGFSHDSRSADKELKAVTPEKSKACVTTFSKKVAA